MSVNIIEGDSLKEMPTFDAESFDAVVTDPPYGIAFMGKQWDAHSPQAYAAFSQAWATEALRVLKPGGYLLAFGGTRTWHRLATGIEDAGFEMRDTITWLYGSGFPKSLDVSKAIDKAAGAEREVTGHGNRPGGASLMMSVAGMPESADLTAPATPDAKKWQGWGTALKPASEPIIVARKPLIGTVAANVLAHGTGALNVDGCRVPMSEADREVINNMGGYGNAGYVPRPTPTYNTNSADNPMIAAGARAHDGGRWPSNVVLSHVRGWDGVDLCGKECVPGCPVAELDDQSGDRAGKRSQRNLSPSKPGMFGVGDGSDTKPFHDGYNDTGGASRFFPVFRYQAKAPTKERPKVDGVAHPTVKPLALMRWLCRLVTPPGGHVLDPFAGSGATMEACMLEGFDVTVIEREPSYLPLIYQRIERANGL